MTSLYQDSAQNMICYFGMIDLKKIWLILVWHETILFWFAFQVDGHNVAAHRVVLACTSNYLFELFMSSPEDGSTTQHIKLENFDFESFDLLIKYAYTSRWDELYYSDVSFSTHN